MVVKNYVKLLNEVADMLTNVFGYSYEIEKFESVKSSIFRVPRLDTYTICFGGHLYITFNDSDNQLEIYNAKATDSDAWFEWFDVSFENKMTIAVWVYNIVKQYL